MTLVYAVWVEEYVAQLRDADDGRRGAMLIPGVSMAQVPDSVADPQRTLSAWPLSGLAVPPVTAEKSWAWIDYDGVNVTVGMCGIDDAGQPYIDTALGAADGETAAITAGWDASVLRVALER